MESFIKGKPQSSACLLACSLWEVTKCLDSMLLIFSFTWFDVYKEYLELWMNLFCIASLHSVCYLFTVSRYVVPIALIIIYCTFVAIVGTEKISILSSYLSCRTFLVHEMTEHKEPGPLRLSIQLSWSMSFATRHNILWACGCLCYGLL